MGSGLDELDPKKMAETVASAAEFESGAREFLTALWGADLAEREVELAGGVKKKFDFVSPDGAIVGDAKYYKNIPVPAAKFSAIAEYVWLLQNVDYAKRRFLVFGRDIEIPERWLARFGPLARGVDFYFLDTDGLVELNVEGRP